MGRTQKKCAACGNLFFAGSVDKIYCASCAKKKRAESTIKLRTCCDCGTRFYGGPRAKRCPDCAQYAQSHRKKSATKRALGSIDRCCWCGSEYIVRSGRQKYCSDGCQRLALLSWQRDRKSRYNSESGQYAAKVSRRKQATKICAYCGREFSSSTSTNLCSDYCRKEQRRINQCLADVNRGRKRNYDSLIEKRNIYRESLQQ